jgi:hypothetical protein
MLSTLSWAYPCFESEFSIETRGIGVRGPDLGRKGRL